MARSNDTDGCGTAFILLVVVYAIVQFIKKNYITICIVLGIIALIILLAMPYSRKKKAESSLSSKSEQTSNPPQKYQPSEAQLNYVNELLERARHLADIINTTMDREKFYISFDELNSVLKCLSQFEDRISFSGALPSAILERINAQKQASIDSLERRIKEAECPEQIDPDIVSGNIVPSVSENDSPIDRRIQMYNGKYDYMDGHDFEYFCADLLRRNGFCNVKVTQESNDQGVDIVAEKDGILYGIQCKRYSSDVGNKAVQEVFSGLAFYHCHVGVVLTNQHFTKSAIELAQVNRVLLWDREKLEILIKNAQ